MRHPAAREDDRGNTAAHTSSALIELLRFHRASCRLGRTPCRRGRLHIWRLVRQPGRPVQRHRDWGCAPRIGSHGNEKSSIGCDGIRAQGDQAQAGVEQRLGEHRLEARAVSTRAAIKVASSERKKISLPSARHLAAMPPSTDTLCSASPERKGPHINLLAARFVGGVCHPAPVGRKGAGPLSRLRLPEDGGFASPSSERIQRSPSSP